MMPRVWRAFLVDGRSDATRLFASGQGCWPHTTGLTAGKDPFDFP